VTRRVFTVRTICVLAIGVLVCADAPATIYYWDTNGASSGIGSAGGGTADWLTNSWATGSSGTLTTGGWPNTQPGNADEAVFMGTAGTANLAADVYANSLRFQTNNYRIASTGGTLHLAGLDPTINVTLPSSNNTATIAAPIVGENGFTLQGNSLSGGLKFLVLANTNGIAPNSFSGTLTIEAGGALRIGGGVANEQIPDGVDLEVAGVIDFVTSGGASDGKQERVRNVSVTDTSSNFSIGNGSDFIVNSISGVSTQSIAINGNNASVPGRLSITGWADGSGDLSLQSSSLKLNTTGSQAAIGGRVVLSRDIVSRGESQVINNNGGGDSTPEWDDNVFTHRAFDFAAAEHTIEVVDGTLTFTSRAPSYPLEITTIQPEGAILRKTGTGIWRLENAVQTTFAGATQVLEGTLSLARPALADAADIHVATGATLELDFTGIDVVNSLFIDGNSQLTGTWGSPTSVAENKSDLLTGNGLLQVSNYVAPRVPGDYNGDQLVDAADYTVWRDSFGDTVSPGSGADGTGPSGFPDGIVNEIDYQFWKSKFGNSFELGGAGSITKSAAIPEPSAIGLIAFALTMCLIPPWNNVWARVRL
jgi:autotransporter-associated beta strand protein